MIFRPTPLAGAFEIDLTPYADERGFFARAWCQREFAEHGLNGRLVQCDISYNRAAGTLRGMHFQRAPHAQAKVVRCIAGALFDAIIDLRPGSPTLGRHHAVELTAANRRALYIPEGFAHGFLTLAPHSEILYQMSEFYEPSSGDGVRWNDPQFGIAWPSAPAVISARDRDYPDFRPAAPPETGR